MKKVIIVGAGIAGMPAGIYALQSGFDANAGYEHPQSSNERTKEILNDVRRLSKNDSDNNAHFFFR